MSLSENIYREASNRRRTAGLEELFIDIEAS